MRAGRVEKTDNAGGTPPRRHPRTPWPDSVRWVESRPLNLTYPRTWLALLDDPLLDLGGTYGDPNAGDPIQYDELCINHDQGDVEIVVYDRARYNADGRVAGDAARTAGGSTR